MLNLIFYTPAPVHSHGVMENKINLDTEEASMSDFEARAICGQISGYDGKTREWNEDSFGGCVRKMVEAFLFYSFIM